MYMYHICTFSKRNKIWTYSINIIGFSYPSQLFSLVGKFPSVWYNDIWCLSYSTCCVCDCSPIHIHIEMTRIVSVNVISHLTCYLGLEKEKPQPAYLMPMFEDMIMWINQTIISLTWASHIDDIKQHSNHTVLMGWQTLPNQAVNHIHSH